MPIALEIVSPERLLLSRPVEMAVLPASEGELAAQQDHAPMIVLLRGGMVRLYENGQVTEQVFVSGGFAEITAERCTVLADEAVPRAELSRAEALRRIENAETAYATAALTDNATRDAALARLQSARAMAEAAPAV